MTIQIRSIRSDEFVAYSQADLGGVQLRAIGRGARGRRSIAEHDREFAAFDGDEIVGGADRRHVPHDRARGRRVACGGVPHVGVQPTHRRRGINTALMRAQLDDMHARGEPLSALHASEAGIYSSFGFGQASFLGELVSRRLAPRSLADHRPTGRVRLVPRDDALGADATGLRRGRRDAARHDRAERRLVLLALRADGDRSGRSMRSSSRSTRPGGAPDAYAVYYGEARLAAGHPDARAHAARDHGDLSPEAYADMWRYVFDIDLIHVLRPPTSPPGRTRSSGSWRSHAACTSC